MLIEVEFSPQRQCLAYNNARLADGLLPPECFRDPDESVVHIVPGDVDPSAAFSVVINVISLLPTELIQGERAGDETN